MKKYNVAVVGVGAVGIEMLRVLKQRNFPVGNLRVFARSARDIEVDGQKYAVEPISPEGFEGIDIALFAGTEGEKGAAVTFAPEAVKRGAIVIDNGADFRMDKNVPLVVPEVNAADVKKNKGIIANPNCSTIQMVVALNPIHKKVGIKRVIVTTLQASSGAGKSAVEQLWSETEEIISKRQKSEDRSQKDLSSVLCLPTSKRAMPQQLAFNVFPHIGSFVEGGYSAAARTGYSVVAGYTNEEWKLVNETHKIMHAPKIKISATTVRVPVRTGHSESVYFETARSISVSQIKSILSKAPGVVLMDEPAKNIYPMPKDSEGKDETFVGRIRQDAFVKNGFWLWVVADNLRKGRGHQCGPDRRMRNLKLEIEYDGSNYAGWQIQPAGRGKTIQQVIEKTLRKLLQEKIKLIVSGRTDSGVHAKAQVANFHTHSPISLSRLKIAVNGLLPEDIKVTKLNAAPTDFHSRFKAQSKLYRYTILNRDYSSPLLRHTVYFYPHPLNVGLMQREAKALLGKHNFSSFQASRGRDKDPVKEIKKINIIKKKGFIYIDIEADGFLYNMVRNIVGTLMEIGRGRMPRGSLKKILSSRDRRLAGQTVPGRGLCLIKVNY